MLLFFLFHRLIDIGLVFQFKCAFMFSFLTGIQFICYVIILFISLIDVIVIIVEVLRYMYQTLVSCQTI